MYTHMKFLSFLTQRLRFFSTNVVKVQVSSILKEKKFDVTSSIWTRSSRPAAFHPNHSTTKDSPPVNVKVKNDHRSKFSNLSNWKEEAWKNLQPHFKYMSYFI